MGIGNEIAIIICGVLLVSVLQVLVIWLSIRRKREARILMGKLDEVLRFQKEFKQNNVEILRLRTGEAGEDKDDTRQEMMDLYRQKLMLCKAEFQKSDASDMLSALKYKPSDFIPESDRRLIVDTISKSFVEIIQELYIEVPDIKTADIDTCILSYLGCDNEMIGSIECVSAAAIRQRKSRLVKRAPEDLCGLFFTTVTL